MEQLPQSLSAQNLWLPPSRRRPSGQAGSRECARRLTPQSLRSKRKRWTPPQKRGGHHPYLRYRRTTARCADKLLVRGLMEYLQNDRSVPARARSAKPGAHYRPPYSAQWRLGRRRSAAGRASRCFRPRLPAIEDFRCRAARRERGQIDVRLIGGAGIAARLKNSSNRAGCKRIPKISPTPVAGPEARCVMGKPQSDRGVEALVYRKLRRALCPRRGER